MKNVLNSVQIFKDVPESAMVETFQFSLGAAEMCMRYISKYLQYLCSKYFKLYIIFLS